MRLLPRYLVRLLIVMVLLGSLTACVPAQPQPQTPVGPSPVPPTALPSTTTPPLSLHLTLGNPSGAVADPAQPANFLILRNQYALAYQRDRGIPLWVSWHLDAADLGATERYTGQFITDMALPKGWYRVTHDDYTGSGYDRGHMAPSADRTASEQDNEATFLLTNVLPQTPESNRGAWEQLEAYARTLVGQGNELYIIAGSAGTQGTLAGGKLTIPAATWKLMVVLPAATGDDLARISAQTRVLAVWMPNTAAMKDQAWATTTTTVRCLEERTGLQFLTALPTAVRTALAGPGCGTTVPTVPAVPTAGVVLTSPTITIVQVIADPPGDDLAGEAVVLQNDGTRPVALTGWTLRDQANTTYTFPTFTLAAGAKVTVWVKAGTDDARNLYWGRGQAVWNNTGDTAILSDAAGTEVARYNY